MRIPCGKTLGQGEYCVEGHLCGHCEQINRLKEALKRFGWHDAPCKRNPCTCGFDKSLKGSVGE